MAFVCLFVLKPPCGKNTRSIGYPFVKGILGWIFTKIKIFKFKKIPLILLFIKQMNIFFGIETNTLTPLTKPIKNGSKRNLNYYKTSFNTIHPKKL